MDDDLKAAEALIWENIRLGYMELVGVGEDGQMRYRLTPLGEAHVEALLHIPAHSSKFPTDTDQLVHDLEAAVRSLTAERDDLHIAIHGCNCPAPYTECPHDEPLVDQIAHLHADLAEARAELAVTRAAIAGDLDEADRGILTRIEERLAAFAELFDSGDYPNALANLVSATATALAYAVAQGRTAVAEHDRAELAEARAAAPQPPVWTEDGFTWTTCAACGRNIYRWRDDGCWQWEHEGGTPHQDHAAQPAAAVADQIEGGGTEAPCVPGSPSDASKATTVAAPTPEPLIVERGDGEMMQSVWPALVEGRTVAMDDDDPVWNAAAPEPLWRCEIDCDDASIPTDYGTGIEHGAFWNWAIFDGPVDPDDLVLSGCSESDPTAAVQEIIARHYRADQLPAGVTLPPELQALASHYVSTYCQHAAEHHGPLAESLHSQCRLHCKTCAASCRCTCHQHTHTGETG